MGLDKLNENDLQGKEKASNNYHKEKEKVLEVVNVSKRTIIINIVKVKIIDRKHHLDIVQY